MVKLRRQRSLIRRRIFCADALYSILCRALSSEREGPLPSPATPPKIPTNHRSFGDSRALCLIMWPLAGLPESVWTGIHSIRQTWPMRVRPRAAMRAVRCATENALSFLRLGVHLLARRGNQSSDFLPLGTSACQRSSSANKQDDYRLKMISAFTYSAVDRFACYMLASSNKLALTTGGCTVSVAGWDRGRLRLLANLSVNGGSLDRKSTQTIAIYARPLDGAVRNWIEATSTAMLQSAGLLATNDDAEVGVGSSDNDVANDK